MKNIFKNHPVRMSFASLCILFVAGIQLWERYAPLSIQDHNKKEIARIRIMNPDRFDFVVFGDNNGSNSILESLLRDIDHDIQASFVVDIGDLVRKERRGLYRRFLHQVKENLAIPFLTAIGNHDLKVGSNKYQEVFGPTYYAFQAGQNHFIVLDASTEERFDTAERQWLEEELKKSQPLKTRFVFMHVPLFDPRGKGFHKCLPEKNGKDLLELFERYHVTHLFASHIHGYFTGVWEGVPYTITGGAGGRLQGSDPNHFFYHYVKVQVHGGNVDTVVRQIDSKEIMESFLDLVRNHALDWGSLLGVGVSLTMVVLSVRNNRGLHKY